MNGINYYIYDNNINSNEMQKLFIFNEEEINYLNNNKEKRKLKDEMP